ncbi:MAG TPA: ATP-binding protein [Myxococcota bacterium]|nr:ATP-binding protein [Myxococcota bacterium]
MHGVALFLLGAAAGALPLALLCARLASVSRARRQRGEALRGALDARIWQDQVERVVSRSDVPDEVRRRRHESNNALSTALLSAQFLFSVAAGERAESLSDQKTAAGELVEALQRLKRLIGEAQGVATTTTSPRAPLVSAVRLLEAVTAAAARLRARFPRLALEVELARPALEGARVVVCAGAEGLAGLLDALLMNACEGDGARGATRVVLRIGAEGEVDVVSLEVTDDGPGFSAAQLGESLQPFASAKPGRLGLGLYTAEHILAASGGSLRRENGPRGGARVTAFLPAAPEPAAGTQ